MKVLVCFLVVIAGALGKASVGFTSGRIIGGSDAERNAYRFQASVQYCIPSGACQHACGGIIISSTTVLTAGHCLTNAPALGSYRVLVGVLNLDDDNAERQLVRVSYAFIHPDYAGGVNPNDLAVLRLATSLGFNAAVGLANLPPVDYHTSGDAIVTGWGSIGGSVTPIMPTTLQQAQVTIINSTACKDALDTLLGGATTPLDLDTNICTGPLTGGVSICTGDSGGPLVYIRFDNTTEVIGISSWGITPCGIAGAPSVYVKLNPYNDWIRSHMFD